MTLPSRIDAERRYDKIRAIALEIAQGAADSKFKLTPITVQALEATSAWEKFSLRQYHWDWAKGHTGTGTAVTASAYVSLRIGEAVGGHPPNKGEIKIQNLSNDIDQ